MKIPFCLPLIDDDVVNEMQDTLKNTGWLTTGPKVKLFEEEIKKVTNAQAVICVNSWNSGATLCLRWWGIQSGDEVIVPAYTYSATALTVMNLGARVVMVDVTKDFNISVDGIKSAITPKTKCIIPVDIGGYPCDYDQIFEIVNDPTIKQQFRPESENQMKLGRILVLADAAHSIGATYKGNPSGSLADMSVFSFHSVKNITTGEGGAVCLNLPGFSNQEVKAFLKHFYLYGQTKSALDKTKIDNWRYDVVSQGMKANMPDICASVGLAQIRKYEKELLPERRAIFNRYNKAFRQFNWAELHPHQIDSTISSCHLYMLRIKDVTEERRDRMIQLISDYGVGVNVHYIPMAMFTFFKSMGYRIEDYPNTFSNYAREISLPIYNGLTSDQIDYVIDTVVKAYKQSIHHN